MSNAAPLALLALLVTLSDSCGGERDADGSPRREEISTADEPLPQGRPREGSGPPPAEALGSEALADGRAGVHGLIRIEGEVPERFPIGARKNKDCTHHPDVEHLSDFVVAEDGRLANAFVYLKSGFDEEAVPSAPTSPVVMDQRGCIYTPHVAAVQVGQPFHVQNSDPTTHNVNLRAPRNNASGNVNMGRGQAALEYVFDRREHPLHLKCDIHPWMSALVYVQDHPWFAVSDREGAFRITDVPPGSYVVEAIHEEFGKVRGRIDVEQGRSTGFALSFQAD